MNKFKVGDKVRINDYCREIHKDKGTWFERFAKKHDKNEIFTIVSVYGIDYFLKEDEYGFYWKEDWLEKAEGDSCKVNVCGVTISGDIESVKKFIVDMAVQCAKAEDIYKIQKLNNLAKDSGEFFKALYGEFERLENGI